MNVINSNNQILPFPGKQLGEQSNVEASLTEETTPVSIDKLAKISDISRAINFVPREVTKLDTESITLLQELQDVSVSKIRPDNVEKGEDKMIFKKCLVCGCSNCNFSNLQITTNGSDVIITYKTVMGEDYLKSQQTMLDKLKQFVSDKIQAPKDKISVSSGVETPPASAKYLSTTANFSQIIISSGELISFGIEREISNFAHGLEDYDWLGFLSSRGDSAPSDILASLKEYVDANEIAVKKDEGNQKDLADDIENKRNAAEEAMALIQQLASKFALDKSANNRIDKLISRLLSFFMN